MAKQIKSKIVIYEGATYIFVSRTKPFTPEEMLDYLEGKQQEVAEVLTLNKAPVPMPKFHITNEMRQIFTSDLRFGLDFCMKKYGVGKQAILSEAGRLNPSMDLSVFK